MALVAVPAAVALLVGVQAVLVAARLPTTLPEAQLVDAAYAALYGVGPPPAPVGLDALAAREQLSAYARATGAFDRHATVLGGARELGLLACAVLVAAVVSLTRSLAVRPLAAAVVLGALAAVPAAVAPLVVVGPGLLGAAWLTLGAALLACRRGAVRALGVAPVVAGVASAPVLAVPVLVGAAAVLVALRSRRGAGFLQVAVPLTVFPLALLPPPGGAAAVPACVVVAVLVGFVLADEALDRVARAGAVFGRVVVGGSVLAGLATAVVVLQAVPEAASRTSPLVAPALAEWLSATTDPATTVSVPPGVWAELLRAGVPADRLAPGGALVVTAGDPASGPPLARFGAGPAALTVVPAGGAPVATPTDAARTAGERLAADPNLSAPEPVRAALRAGEVDPRVVTVLVALTGRGPVSVVDLPAVPDEDPAVPRHRAVLADLDPSTRTFVATQLPPYTPIVTDAEEVPATVLTWPLPAPTG